MAGAAVAAAAGLPTTAAHAARREAAVGRGAQRPTVVLVHGAFADGSSWGPVIDHLHRAGYSVRSLANPLRGLAADAAHVRSVLETLSGPVVLVGHSHGGAVITEAAAEAAQVRALVYVASFVPDAGEVLGELAGRFPRSELEAALTSVPSPGPDGSLAAAWRTIPSWNLVATVTGASPPPSSVSRPGGLARTAWRSAARTCRRSALPKRWPRGRPDQVRRAHRHFGLSTPYDPEPYSRTPAPVSSTGPWWPARVRNRHDRDRPCAHRADQRARPHPRHLCARPVAAAEQLGPLGRPLRGGRIRAAGSGLAG